ILRQILANDKEGQLKEIEAIENSSESSPEQIAAAQQARAYLESRRTGGERKSNFVHDLLTADSLRSGLTHIKGISTAGDAISATRSFIGTASAGVNAIGDAFGPVGGAIARVITTAGEIAFEQNMQTMQARMDLLRGQYSNRALMGGSIIDPIRTDQYGMSYTDFTNTFGSIATASGTSNNVQQKALSA